MTNIGKVSYSIDKRRMSKSLSNRALNTILRVLMGSGSYASVGAAIRSARYSQAMQDIAVAQASLNAQSSVNKDK